MRRAHADRHNFDNQQAAAQNCAMRIAAQLSLAVHERGRAVLAVSADADMPLLPEMLSQADIAWEAVTICPIDEIYVPLDNPRSREAILRRLFLRNKAAAARFAGLYNQARTAELAAFSASARIDRLNPPFDCIIADMDAQGQTAGWLKGSSRLQAALNPLGRALILPNYSKQAGETHLTMSLPLIRSAALIVLPLCGKDKLPLLEEALQDGRNEAMPIRAVLHQAAAPVQIFWSAE